ncbi:MAG TPA: MraY family glycosyltransferase, partial [Mycobacteriales bacterium]|nr:MraY family glycosyltransferase [Mycobacteriales bacterium]
MREYALVFCVAAAVTFLLTPVVRVLARRWGAVARPRDRDVHAIPTPRLGGVAIFAGMAVALLVANLMPTLQRTYQTGSETTAVLIAGGIICLLGVLDDRWELDSLTKLAGQVFAAGIMVLLGVQLLTLYVPWGGVGTLSFGRNDSVGLTVLLCLLTINAINFIDGLDGLAAGVSGISALAFFAYSYHMAREGYDDVAFAPTLLSAVLAGACLGFLPHNFSPARVFMGDSGSMLIGLTLAAAATTASTGADPQSFGNAVSTIPLYLPFLLPLVVLAVPLVDLALAVLRRVKAGRSPFAPDKMHLHHRLLEIGHSHRRAVLLIYFWSALLAFGGVAMSIADDPLPVLSAVGGLAAIALVLYSVPRLRA